MQLESTSAGKKEKTEIQFGSKEQQEEEGEKSYCSGIFHGQPSVLRAGSSDTKPGIPERTGELECSRSPSLADKHGPALR